MEWVSPCLWKLNLFLNCWKVRQTGRVTQEARWKWIVNKCLSASSPYFLRMTALPLKPPALAHDICLVMTQPLGATPPLAPKLADHSGPSERLDLGHGRGRVQCLPGPVHTSVKLGACGAEVQSTVVCTEEAGGHGVVRVRGSRFTSCLIYKLCDVSHKP